MLQDRMQTIRRAKVAHIVKHLEQDPGAAIDALEELLEKLTEGEIERFEDRLDYWFKDYHPFGCGCETCTGGKA